MNLYPAHHVGARWSHTWLLRLTSLETNGLSGEYFLSDVWSRVFPSSISNALRQEGKHPSSTFVAEASPVSHGQQQPWLQVLPGSRTWAEPQQKQPAAPIGIVFQAGFNIQYLLHKRNEEQPPTLTCLQAKGGNEIHRKPESVCALPKCMCKVF